MTYQLLQGPESYQVSDSEDEEVDVPLSDEDFDEMYKRVINGEELTESERRRYEQYAGI